MTSRSGWLHQDGFRVRLEWGHRGAHEAGVRGDIVVIVDVLSFSTAVTAAIECGATIVPFRHRDRDAAQAEAERLRVHISPPGFAKGRRRALSPVRFVESRRLDAELLCSPNGATCVDLAAVLRVRTLCTFRPSTQTWR